MADRQTVSLKPRGKSIEKITYTFSEKSTKNKNQKIKKLEKKLTIKSRKNQKIQQMIYLSWSGTRSGNGKTIFRDCLYGTAQRYSRSY